MTLNRKSQTRSPRSASTPLFGWMRLAGGAQRSSQPGESGGSGLDGSADQGYAYSHEPLLTHFERPHDWSLLSTAERIRRVFDGLQDLHRWEGLLIGTYRLWLFSDWETLALCVRDLVRTEPDVFAGEHVEGANWLAYAGVHAERSHGERRSASDLQALIRWELTPLLKDYDRNDRAGMLMNRGLFKAALKELEQVEHADVWDRYLTFMALETRIICSQATGDFRGGEKLLKDFSHAINDLNIARYRSMVSRAQLSFYNEWERFDESARLLSLNASETSDPPIVRLLQLQEKIRFELMRGDVDNLFRLMEEARRWQEQGQISRSVLAFGEERCRFLILTHAPVEAWQFCEVEYKRALADENYASQAAIGFCYARALAEVGREQQALVVCRAARSLADEQYYCKSAVMLRILESVLLNYFHRQTDARNTLGEARKRAVASGFQLQLLCVELIEALIFSDASVGEIFSEGRLVSAARKVRSSLNYYLPTSIHRVRRAGKVPGQPRGESSSGIVPFSDAITSLLDRVCVVFLVNDGSIMVSDGQAVVSTSLHPTRLSGKILQLLLTNRLRADAAAIHDLQYPGVRYDPLRHSSKVRMALSRLRAELVGLTRLVRIRHDGTSGMYRLESEVPVYTFDVEHIRCPERQARTSVTPVAASWSFDRTGEEKTPKISQPVGENARARSRAESRKLIVDALQAAGPGGLSTAELCDLLGISRQALNKTVADLCDRGIIERLGKGKATRYCIGR